jgi:hypothetical protein
MLNTDKKSLIERYQEINFLLIEAEGDDVETLQAELSDIETELEYNGVNVEDIGLYESELGFEGE